MGKKRGPKTDELSPFHWYMHRIHGRRFLSERKETDIDERYLKQVWDGQGGVCPYTGRTLSLSRTASGNQGWLPYQASLDRIDSERGYIRGNVQYVALIANLAKGKFSEDELIEFCKTVAHHRMDLAAILGS